MSQAQSPAERRRETQRARIIAEASKLFHEHGAEEGGGFDATTIESIAERADISVRTFFRYFDSKADVIYLDTARSLQDLRSAVTQRMEIDRPLRAVVNGSMDVLTAFVANPVNKARLALALNSKNWSERRALWTIQKRELVTELLLPYCGRDAAAYSKAHLTAVLGLSVNDTATATWARFPKANLVQMANDAVSAMEPIIARFELDATPLPRAAKAARA